LALGVRAIRVKTTLQKYSYRLGIIKLYGFEKILIRTCIYRKINNKNNTEKDILKVILQLKTP
jgi:hypothetical protein